MSVFFAKIFFKRTGIYPNTDGHAVALGTIHHPADLLHGTDVARIDAQLMNTVFDGLHCQIGIKMNISAQRHGRCIRKGTHILRAYFIIHRKTHQITPRSRKLLDLSKRLFKIAGICVGHALYGYRSTAADF